MTNIDDILYSSIQASDRAHALDGQSPDRLIRWKTKHTYNNSSSVNVYARHRANVHSLLLVLEEAVAPALEHYLFELNNKITRQSVIESVSGVLGRQEGLREYRVVCDETNNSPETIINNQLVVDVWYKPMCSVEIGVFRAKLGEDIWWKPVFSNLDLSNKGE